MTRSTAPRAAGWLAVAGLLTAAIISPAATMAATVTPTAHEGNITSCPQGYLTIAIDGPTENTTDQKTVGGVTVGVTYSAGQTTVAFTVTGGVVNIAYIKGGDGYNAYNYGPAGTTGDTGLVSPLVGQGKNIPVVSHSVFCATAQTTTTTTTANSTTQSTTSAETTETTTVDTTTTKAETTTTTTDGSTTTTAGTTTTTTDGSTTTTAGTTTTTTASSTTAAETTATTTTAATTSAETSKSKPSASPSGNVLSETGAPQITPPPTDAMGSTGTPVNGSWRLVILAVAGLLSGLLVLTPATARKRR